MWSSEQMLWEGEATVSCQPANLVAVLTKLVLQEARGSLMVDPEQILQWPTKRDAYRQVTVSANL